MTSTQPAAAETADRGLRAVWLPPLIDLVFVLAFVLIGRSSHEEGNAARLVVETATPFVIGLVVALAIAWPLGWSRVRAGLVIWPVTVAVGMIVRRAVFDRTTAAVFVVVTALFLGLVLVGWRIAAAAWVGRRRTDGQAG